MDGGGSQDERYLFHGQSSYGCPGEPVGEQHETRITNSKQRTGQRQKAAVSSSNKPLTIKQLLYEFPRCPPSAYMHIKEFFNNDNINNTLTNCKFAERDVRNWCHRLNSWSIQDYVNYYADANVFPYFNAYNHIHDTVYYDVNRSVSLAAELLSHQFDNDSRAVVNFLTVLLNVIDKRIPKLNTIAVHCAPCSGKNFFFDAVVSFFINYGAIETANKTNNFAF